MTPEQNEFIVPNQDRNKKKLNLSITTPQREEGGEEEHREMSYLISYV